MNWWIDLYDQQMVDLFLLRDPQQAHQETSLLEELLQLQPENHILDQCCGIGSLSIPLAQKGYRVTGVDIIPSYIHQAQEKSGSSRAQFFCADACNFIAEPCDAAFNWWTGFGYGTDQQAKKMLECAFESLRSGGLFVLDFINAPGIIRHFKTKSQHDKDGTLLTRESSIDWYNGRLNQRWCFQNRGNTRIVNSSIRFYQPYELVALFREVGFIEIQLFGDRQKQPVTIDSMRCICLAKKP